MFWTGPGALCGGVGRFAHLVWARTVWCMFRSSVVAGLFTVTALSPLACSPTSSLPAATVSWKKPAAVSFVGDSLTAASESSYRAALLHVGVNPISLSGVSSRALRFGWQCFITKTDLVVRSAPIPGKKCAREGLEELTQFARSGKLGDAVVVALGTNDAGLYWPEQQSAHLDTVRKIVGARPLYLVSTVTVHASSNARMIRYNAVAAAWCKKDSKCRVIDWAATAEANNPALYGRDGVHMGATGTGARAEFIAKEVVRLAVPPPPPATTTTTVKPAPTTVKPAPSTTVVLPPPSSSSTTSSTTVVSTSTTFHAPPSVPPVTETPLPTVP